MTSSLLRSPTRILCVLGLPGSGKSTVCAALAVHFGCSVVAVGSLLQERAAHGDSRAAALLRSGRGLSPSDFAALMSPELTDSPLWILDGSPREPDQVRALAELVAPGTEVVGILVEASADVALERLTSRRTQLSMRADETPATIVERVRVQTAMLDEVVARFLQQWGIARVDGTLAPELVVAAAIEAAEKFVRS